jgi:hypothetical protein
LGYDGHDLNFRPCVDLAVRPLEQVGAHVPWLCASDRAIPFPTAVHSRCISACVIDNHDLLREEELVDFAALLPRPDDEPVDDFFAAERDRPADDSLDDDFFAAGRDRLGDDSLDDDFFAAGRDRLGDDSLDDDFFAVGRGRLDVAAVGAGFLGELLAGGPEADCGSES